MPKPAPRATFATHPFAELLTPAPSTPGQALDGARLLPLALVDPNPYQARQAFDEAALAELADSIRQQGVLQPIVVRPVGEGRYQIVAGERRTRAARLAGLTDIPAIIREGMTDDEALVATAVENDQRTDLDIEDQARFYQHLLNVLKIDGTALAVRLGRKPDYINRRLRLVNHPDLMARVRRKEITLDAALSNIRMIERLERLPAPTSDANGVDQRDAFRTEGDSNHAPPLSTERYALNQPSRPGDFAYRPFQQAAEAIERAGLAVGRLKLTDLAPPERPLLAGQLDELLSQNARLGAHLQRLRDSLDED